MKDMSDMLDMIDKKRMGGSQKDKKEIEEKASKDCEGYSQGKHGL